MVLIPYVKQTHNCLKNMYLNTIQYTEKKLIYSDVLHLGRLWQKPGLVQTIKTS